MMTGLFHNKRTLNPNPQPHTIEQYSKPNRWELTGAHHQMANDNHQTKTALANLLSKTESRMTIREGLRAQGNAQ